MYPAACESGSSFHFLVDVLLNVPLLIDPIVNLRFFGWEFVDPMTTRLVGAALMAIGFEPLLSTNAKATVFRAMLNLKIIWSV